MRKRIPKSKPNEGWQYFKSVVEKYEGDLCLIWPFGRGADGYGLVRPSQNRNSFRVSRLACESHNGACPEDKVDAAHSCGNGHIGCCTKKHLRWASRKENVADARLHGRIPLGSASASSRLTEQDVLNIRERRANGERLRVIGEDYSMEASAISQIVNRKIWTHI